MLLGIYLGTTAFVWYKEFKLFIDMDKRLKKEGYTFTSKRINGIGDIIIGGAYIIAISIPILNLIFPLASWDKEKTYDEYKNMLLEAGHIEEPVGDVVNKDNLISTINKSSNKVTHNTTNYHKSMDNNIEHNITNDNGYTYKKSLIKRRH